jgi:hypothetical protein
MISAVRNPSATPRKKQGASHKNRRGLVARAESGAGGQRIGHLPGHMEITSRRGRISAIASAASVGTARPVGPVAPRGVFRRTTSRSTDMEANTIERFLFSFMSIINLTCHGAAATMGASKHREDCGKPVRRVVTYRPR